VRQHVQLSIVAEWVLDPDTALMMKVSTGDEPSFEVLLQRHRAPVIHQLNRMVRNRAIAEELAQDVFLRVYRSRGTYRPGAKFATWLFRITTNVALNWRRDTRRERVNIRLDERPIRPRAPSSAYWNIIAPPRFAQPWICFRPSSLRRSYCISTRA